MSKCLTCEHLALFQKPVEGRALSYIGACAQPGNTIMGRGRFCAATRGFAEMCPYYEQKGARALAEACESEDAA